VRLLIKYATRQRPELFEKTLQNIYTEISGKIPFQVLVSIDKDDHEMVSLHNIITAYTYPLDNLDFFIGLSKSKVHAINRDIEKAKPWDILINMSDDMRFVTRSWDLLMVDLIKGVWGESTDFFAHFNDGYLGEKLPTMSIMGRDYYNRFGYVYHPDYKSFSCDAEAMYVAQMLGKWHYFPEVLFKHEHPANNRSISNDDLYVRSSLHTPHDTKVYWQRLNNYFYVPDNQRVCVPFAQHLGRTV